MGAKAIHQLTSFARRGDAVYDHAEQLRKIILSWGYRSTIYVLDEATCVYDGVEYYKKLRAGRDDILLYHFGLGSVLTRFFLDQPGKKFLLYHNMTPEKYLIGIDNQSFLGVRRGRKELDEMKPRLDGALGHSHYTSQDIVERNGYTNVGVLPILKDFSVYEGKTPLPERLDKWRSDKKTIFFIGRVVANKCQADLVRTLHAYTKLYGNDARLVMPGSWKNTESYRDHLRHLARSFDIEDSVIIPGFIDDEDFFALFSMADVYLSLSEHEGFGVPLLEAMWFGAPVVAYAVCSIPEILGDTGVKLHGKDPAVTATVLREIFENPTLKEKIVTAQKARLREYSPEKISGILRDTLAPFL